MSKTNTDTNQVAPHHYGAAIVVVLVAIAVLIGAALFLWQDNKTSKVGTTKTTQQVTNTTTNSTTNSATNSSTNSTTTNSTTSETTTTPSNKYSGMTAKVGDKVAGMTLTHKEGSLSDPNTPVTNDIILVHFSGETTVSGTYQYFKNEMTGSYQLSFTVSDSDLAKIPYMSEKSSPTKSFVIENEVYAYPLLGITQDTAKSGSAKIVINSFYDPFVGAEVAPTASLIKVQ